MRERWKHQSDFIADVLRFGLWASHYPAPHQGEAADAMDEVIFGPDRCGSDSCEISPLIPSAASAEEDPWRSLAGFGADGISVRPGGVDDVIYGR
jgi:hypothetical protein